MGTLRVIGCVLGGLACLAVAVLGGLDGETFLLVGGLGFALACFGGAFLAREPDAPEEPLRTGSVTARGRTFTGLVITFSSGRAIAGELIAIGFVALGVGLALDGALIVGIGCAAVFGVMAVLGAAQLVRGAGTLVLGDDELAHIAAGGRASVRWADVTGVARYEIRGVPILRVDSRGGAEMDGGLAVLLAMMTRRTSIDLPLSAIGVDPDWLEQTIRERVANAASAARDASPAASG